jgi:hypothetical protein
MSESGARPVAEVRVASLGYLAAMGIPLRAGRLLDEHDYGQQTVVINDGATILEWRCHWQTR